jgi:O-methyltransferase
MLPASVRHGQQPVTGLSPAELYIELLKRTLVNWPYDAMENTTLGRDPRHALLQRESIDAQEIMRRPRHTMVGLIEHDALHACVENVLADKVPGDFIETGVWRGGMTILMRALLAAYGISDRRVWVADSFQGLPSPDVEKYPADRDVALQTIEELRVSLDQVRSHFDRYGLLDDQVRFLPGWFRDTLPTAPIEALAIMRLDGDMYESTIDALTALYPKLSGGGYVIVDDYGAVLACRQAVHDYRATHGIVEPIVAIDWTGAYWRKGGIETAAIPERHDGPAAPAGNIPAKPPIVDEGQQIKALNDRIQVLSHHEAKLQDQLATTRQQVLDRDRAIQGLGELSYSTALRRVLRPLIPAPLRPLLRRAAGLKD